MAQIRIQDGLERLVEYFLSNRDDKAVAQTLELCQRLLERFNVFEVTRLTIRQDDDGESIRDVEHVSELIKRRCI
jgi:hypothetical protein